MMSSEFSLNAEPRVDKGKGASRRLRRAGRLPAILYGAGQEAAAISLGQNEILRNLENEAFFSHVLTIHLGGRQEKAVLRDMQRHPAKPMILHVDLQRVKEDEAVHMRVPLHFVGEDVAPGIKLQGGAASHLLTEVEVECLPSALPEYIDVNMSSLGLNESIRVSDLRLPEGVSLLGVDLDAMVVSIGLARSAEEAPAEGEAAEGEEGAVPPAEGEAD
jgi:large subunit ribosomal protein L25